VATTSEYNASSIQVLQAWEAVRKRPGMYIGGVDRAAMHHLLWEILGNAIDETLAGFGTHVRVDVDGPRITIEDDGRGIPPSVIDRIFTVLHGGAYKQPHVHLSSSMWGIGAMPVCALSSELEVTVWRDGHEHRQRFVRGEPNGELEYRGRATRTGTRVSFVPDFTIIEESAWDVPMIHARCHDLAALLPGTTIVVDGHTHRFDKGLGDLVREDRELVEPMHVRVTDDGITIDVAIGWHAGPPSIRGFVNGSPSIDGVHLEALRNATHAVVARRTRVSRTRLEKHMVAVVHVMLADPRYGNPSRDWLQNPEVEVAVRTVVERELALHFDEAPAALDALLLLLEPKRQAVKSIRTLPQALRARAKSKASRTRES